MRKTKLEIAVCVALCGALFSYASMAGESTADVRSNVHVSIRKVSDQWDEAVQTLSGETQNVAWAGYSLGDGVAKDLSEDDPEEEDPDAKYWDDDDEEESK